MPATATARKTTTKPATTKPTTATRKPATTTKPTTATTKPTTATTKPATTKPATTKPATTKPATTKPATTKPATTKPADAHTAAQIKEITTLQNSALKFRAAGERAALDLAETIVKLYALAPWDGQKLSNGHAMNVKTYYATVIGIGTADDKFSLPPAARRAVVKAMANTVDVDTVVAMTGSSNRTIQRDRDFLKIANTARQESHAGQSTAATTDNDTPEVPDRDGPVTRMVAVVSLTDVRAYITSLRTVGNRDALEELSDLVAECLAALPAE